MLSRSLCVGTLRALSASGSCEAARKYPCSTQLEAARSGGNTDFTLKPQVLSAHKPKTEISGDPINPIDQALVAQTARPAILKTKPQSAITSQSALNPVEQTLAGSKPALKHGKTLKPSSLNLKPENPRTLSRKKN